MAPIPPDPHADHAPAVDDMPLDTTAAPDIPAAVDPVPHGMAAHVLEREVGPLMARFPGVADEATVRQLLFDSYAELAETSRHPEMLPTTSVQPVSYTHLTLPTIAAECRSRWSPYH